MRHRRLWPVLVVGLVAGEVTLPPAVADEGRPWTGLRVDAGRIEQRILELARFGQNPRGGVSRLAFSEADIEGRRYVVSLMEDAGLDVRVDEAGNILGRRAGKDEALPPILFGSHIDSVPEGGNYDGDVGVVAAIECAQVLAENEVETRHPLEVVVFADEEGGLSGSRGMLGTLSPEALEIVSHSGKTIREGLRGIGGDPDRLERAVRRPGDIAAYLELHVEQGSILDTDGIDIGIVQGTAWTGSATLRRSSPGPRTWPTGPTSSCRRSSGSIARGWSCPRFHEPGHGTIQSVGKSGESRRTPSSAAMY